MNDETIFAVALEKADPAARAAYLAAACADTDQRRRIEGLLRAVEHAGDFLEKPAVPPPGPGQTDTRAERTPDSGPDDGAEDAADALAFLAPAQRPESLGRIGHYEVLEVLGRGAFGVVYRAFDDVLQRVVAVKVLSPAMAATSPARKRFIREARSAALVQHEHVVRVHAVEEQPLPYLVMEYISGETLQTRIDRAGPLEAPEVVRIGRQIAEGLAAAHEKGLVHRDIKPSNVLIELGSQSVKITDFGLARAADDASLTRSGVVAGTPMYMAPEQARGKALDHRADLFSLGSVLYALLTGHPPFRAETTFAVLRRVVESTPRPIPDVIPEVPGWLCRIVAKLHAKDPDERYQRAREVAEVLADCEKQLQEHRAVRDLSRIPTAKPKPRPQRAPTHLLVLALAVGVGLTLLGAVALGLVLFLTPTSVEQHGFPQSGGTRWTGDDSLADEQGWVQLFNGRDLTGWKPSPNEPANVWQVYHPNQLGAEGDQPAHLFSERGDYTNYNLRIEFLVGGGATASQILRAPPNLNSRWRIWPDTYPVPDGLITPITPQEGRKVYRVGELAESGPVRSLPPGPPGQATVAGDYVRENEWVTQDVTVRGDRVTFNSKPPYFYVAEPTRSRTGHIVLGHYKGKVRIRKIAIKELPREPDQWVQMFNGRNLAGWQFKPGERGEWKVADNVLALKGKFVLATKHENFNDFHARMEMRVGPASELRQFFRADVSESAQRTGTNAPRGYQVKIGGGQVEGVSTEELSPGKRKPLPKDWFKLDLVAKGAKVFVRLDGETLLEYEDRAKFFSAGGFYFESLSPESVVEIRRIEINEQPEAQKSTEELVREERASLTGEWLVTCWTKEGEPLGVLAGPMKLILQHTSFSLTGTVPGAKPLTGVYSINPHKKELAFRFDGAKGGAVRCKYRSDSGTLKLDFAGRLDPDSAPTAPFVPLVRTSAFNLKLLGVAMHNYASTNGFLPPAALTNAEGKPLLSWRVALLPYLEQEALYKQFKLDEPWDSEHNKKLIDKMPEVYARPAIVRKAHGLTHYQVFVGPGSLFEPQADQRKGLHFVGTTDTTANTLLIAEGAAPVTWTKPDDLIFDPTKAPPKLGTGGPDVPAEVCLADGSVRTLPPGVPADVIQALVARNGNEVIDAPFLKPVRERPSPPLKLELRLPASPPAP